MFHHQQGVDGLVHTGGAKGMARHRLGGGELGRIAAKQGLDGFQLLGITDRGGGAVGVDVIHRADVLHRHLHATHRAFTARGDHVVAVGGGTVTGDFGVDVGTAGQGMFQLLDHQDAAATGDDETVAVRIIGTGRLFRGVIVLGGEGAHGIELDGGRPVQLLAAAGEDDVLLAKLDQLQCVTDAVGRGGTGGADGVVDTLDLERGGQAGRGGGGHGARHHVGTHALDPFLTGDVRRLGGVLAGGAAGADHYAGTLVGDLILWQTRVSDSLLHGQIGIGRGVTHETHDFTVDQFRRIEFDVTPDTAAQVVLFKLLGIGDAGFACFQGGQHLFLVVADTGDDADTGDHCSSH
ncbi:hypothetical protein D3C72_1025850 [compost metagenome]